MIHYNFRSKTKGTSRFSRNSEKFKVLILSMIIVIIFVILDKLF